MEIQTLPPRRMCRVIAIRADSICRLVTYAGSRAWIAYSPKLISVPPLARPVRAGWCCLRCLTRRGISTCQPSVWVSVAVASAAAVPSGPAARGTVRSGAARRGGRRVSPLRLGVGGRRLGGCGPLGTRCLRDGLLGSDLAGGHGHAARRRGRVGGVEAGGGEGGRGRARRRAAARCAG